MFHVLSRGIAGMQVFSSPILSISDLSRFHPHLCPVFIPISVPFSSP